MEVSPRRVGRFGADMNVTDVVSVAAGDAHTCARRSGGSVWCWGAALDGRLAIDPPPGESDIPTDTGVVAERIVLGGGHGCALGEAGLSCWGRNDHGQVGVGDPLYFSRPRLVEGNAVDTTSDRPLALGDYHTCNVATTGRGAVCFGRGIDAQLGQGEWESSSRPVVVAAGTAAAVISSEDDHTCVLDASGRASCWGPNYLGQLGDGTTTDSASPRPVSAAPTFAQIDVGERHTCAVTDEGVVWCWGSNVGGQLGTGTSDPSPHPVPQAIVGIRADHVAAADDFTCALASSELYCWGHPDARIGRGGSDPYLPTLVDGIDAASMLWVGDQTGCVLNGGALQCWGLNDEGQLGALPDPVPVPEPLALPAGLTSVESVAIGEGHLCVLSGGGELACLGRNDAGQLGGGTFDDPGATRVDLARVQHVAAGWRHTCAVLEAGELHCWGSDLDGRLGSGRDLAVVPPRPVAWADP
jgi:alpha-tubulin suppressor-like RCC1 family protein